MKKYGWDEQSGDSEDVKKLRVIVLKTASFFGHPLVIQEAKKRMLTNSGITTLLKELIYNSFVNSGSQIEFEMILKRFNSAPDESERRFCINSMMHSKNHDNLRLTLQIILESVPFIVTKNRI